MARNRLRVLELFCGRHDVRSNLIKEFPRHRIDYTGIDSLPDVALRVHSRKLPYGKNLYIDRLHVRNLTLHDPGHLSGELTSVLRRQQFDRMYVVMPPGINPIYRGQQGALVVLGRFLKPGGRLTYVVDNLADLLGSSLIHCIDLPLGSDNTKSVYAWNKAHLKSLAKPAGLLVRAYAFKPHDGYGQARYPWYTKDLDFTSISVSDWVQRISADHEYAQHAVVFERPGIVTGSSTLRGR